MADVFTHEKFKALVEDGRNPVVLVEGRRDVPERDMGLIATLAELLAGRYPGVTFRTGNAVGADTAFAQGVCKVDPERLEVVLPYAGHRKAALHEKTYRIPLSRIPPAAEARLAFHTSAASPKYGSMMEKRHQMPRLQAKARYILRDTLKVVGSDEIGLRPATCGLFYVNPVDPMKGGTGHTIRVCRQQHIPLAFQEEWMHWGESKVTYPAINKSSRPEVP